MHLVVRISGPAAKLGVCANAAPKANSDKQRAFFIPLFPGDVRIGLIRCVSFSESEPGRQIQTQSAAFLLKVILASILSRAKRAWSGGLKPARFHTSEVMHEDDELAVCDLSG